MFKIFTETFELTAVGYELYSVDLLQSFRHQTFPMCCATCVSLSRETYNTLTNWLTDARTLASPNIVIILCGNKKDLDADREVTFMEASRFAQENGKCSKKLHFVTHSHFYIDIRADRN